MIIGVIHLIRELLFPGYFGEQHQITATYGYHVGNALVEIHDKLYGQILLALNHCSLEKKVSELTAQALLNV